MRKGTVKWFNPTKGIGFITPMDGTCDVLIDAATLATTEGEPLVEGQRVTFHAEASDLGPRATLLLQPAS